MLGAGLPGSLNRAHRDRPDRADGMPGPDGTRDRCPRHRRRGAAVRARRFWRSLTRRLSSSLTRRIVVLNLGGLAALLMLFLYLNQFRQGLIEARVQSLQTQSEIIAAAVAASAAVETDAITIDPEKLLQLAPGQSTGALDQDAGALEFSINPERIGPVLRRLVSPTRTRARIYDKDGDLLLDSRALLLHGSILRADLTRPEAGGRGLLDRFRDAAKHVLGRADPPVADEDAGKGPVLPEVGRALAGQPQSIVRVNARGETIVSVAVPIERFRAIRGVLLLSTQGGDIDAIIASERWAMFRIFLVAAAVTFGLSLFLANTIAGPVRRLADAADRVRRGSNSREEIPDFTSRSDEIGHLSGALRDMTGALYSRMEAIESFAADVAHELKNPLTSLRSAVETLPRVKAEASRERLTEVIQHDIRRLDRLISDISDASRLDAELARGSTGTVEIEPLLSAVVAVANGVTRADAVSVGLTVTHEEADRDGEEPSFLVDGHDSRLGQVFNNLIDNARSFSPRGGTVRVTLRHARDDDEEDARFVEIVVDDDGPGIPAHAFERIFERFYTDRPEQGFGQNSGLGLSISRQIIEAHGGRIWARNRSGEAAQGAAVSGARFTVRLPAKVR